MAIATLAVAFGLAFAVYGPALRSAFLGDDYIYLLSARDMPLSDYLRAALVPGTDPGRLILAEHYWRPLSFLLSRGLYELFGNAPTGYHIVSLGIHLAGIVMVWLLAQRLIRHLAATAVATVTFAIHPAGFESITWISALNSAALPLALGGWLAFVSAVESDGRRGSYRNHAFAVFLIALSLGFRETGAVVLPAMGFWYLLVVKRDRLHEARTYLALTPYAALVVLYLLTSTAFFTDRSGDLLSVGSAALRRTWYYARQALMPTDLTSPWSVVRLQQGLGLVVLATPLVALIGRRWLLLALSLGFLASLVPFGLFNVGYGARYFYMPSAFFALAAGAAVVEVWPLVVRFLDARMTKVAATGVAVVVLAATVVGNRRVDRWANGEPASEQRWVDDLRRNYPDLPDGGTLYVTNLPFAMALIDGYVVEPTVAYLYPGGTHHVQIFYRVDLEAVRPWLEPRDRLFVFGEQ
ncbi:MAG: glycosyltransferase family 39 protein [Anaerolineaceae bacterium]